MPELPEVETVVRDLRPMLVGQRLVHLTVGSKALRLPWNPMWTKAVLGAEVQSIRRRAKWIIMDLGTEARLMVHLGMTGQFTVNPRDEPLPNHTHFVFDLSDELHQLRFRDVRRFGSIQWFVDEGTIQHYLADKLGPEPLDLDASTFRRAVQSTTRTLKAVLLDQSIAAGVGNIYADESLHLARLHPERRGATLTGPECDRLRLAIAQVIEKAIVGRGSTIRDYIGGSGLRGEFQNEFCVYGRTGEPCLTCGTPIDVVRVSGRSSHFCRVCQPPPRR
jgi:formamidopyrimidine-DNA glycosylase